MIGGVFSLLEDELRLPGKSDEGYTAKLNKVIQAYALQQAEDKDNASFDADGAAAGECTLCVSDCACNLCGRGRRRRGGARFGSFARF